MPEEVWLPDRHRSDGKRGAPIAAAARVRPTRAVARGQPFLTALRLVSLPGPDQTGYDAHWFFAVFLSGRLFAVPHVELNRLKLDNPIPRGFG